MTEDLVSNHERTQDIYEQLPSYPKPPLIPVPEWGDWESLREMGIKLNAFSLFLIKTAMFFIGFRSFYKKLPQTMEHLMRTSNMRGAGLFATINSASLALARDKRNLSAAERAATLISAVYSFHDDLYAGTFKPDMYKDHVLEMGQYPNFFATSLIIEGKRARLYKSAKTSQITVIVNGRYFLLEVGHPGKDTSVSQLTAALEKIIRKVKQESPQRCTQSIGSITGAAHPVQLQIFSRLLQNPQNKEAYEKIRHSFFTLCLDLDDLPQTEAEAAFLTQSRNQYNRWHHSSLQIVVFGNGMASTFCNFNAYLDGNPMMRGSAEIQRRAAAAAINSDPVEKPAEAQELNWQIADAAIERARKNIEPVIDNQQATFVIDGIGKSLFRQYGLQPVPVFMLAIDMAVRKHTGKHGAISQYLSMSKYRCMNLANANSTTAEVKRFTEFTEQENFNTTEAFALMKEAVKSQIDAYRSARKYLSMSNMISLFLNSKKGFAKVAVSLLLGLVIFKLKIFGLYKSEAPEIPASHPDIFPEVPVVGRPGIKLPYIRYFGFHYQIMDDKTIITYMPSTRWRVSNKELTETIKEKAGILKTILEMNK